MSKPSKYQTRIRILIALFMGLFLLLFVLLAKLIFFTPRQSSKTDCKDCFSTSNELVGSNSNQASDDESVFSSTSDEQPDDNVDEQEEVVPSVDTQTITSIYKVTNKSHLINSNYVPSDLRVANVSSNGTQYLRDEAATHLEQMIQDASRDGIQLYLVSGYRSYSTQVDLYNEYVRTDGKELADTYDAQPGASEHQLGLAVDLSDGDRSHDIDYSFEGTSAYQWLLSNSYKYGYILRYPQNKQSITGIVYNPWSFRYIGVEEATKIYESGLTVEEYYKIQ